MTALLAVLASLAAAGATVPHDDDDARERPVAAKTARAHRDADDDDGDERQVPVTEIVVTSRRLDAARASVEPSLGASVYSLGNETVEARPGGETGSLASVLTQFPGARPDGKGGTVVSGAPGAVQYRLNNVILPEGAADLGEHLSSRLAARIELVTGALPAQYGLMPGGVVNITTKSGHYMAGGQAELYGGTAGMFEPAFEWAGNQGATSLFVSGSHRRSDVGFASPDGSAVPAHDRAREYEGLAFADHVIDDSSRISLIFGFSDERKEIPAIAVPAVAGSENRFGTASSDSEYLVLSYLRSSGDLSLQASLFGLTSRSRVMPDETLALQADGIARSSAERRRSAGVQIEAAYALGAANTIRAGFIGAVDDAANMERIVSPLAASETNGGGSRWTTSLFVQDEWKLTSALTLNMGLRADRVSGAPDRFGGGPRSSLVWQMPGGLTAHLGYARYFVAPSSREAAATPLERDDYLDAGIEWKIEDFTLGVDGYYRWARGLLAERGWASGPAGDPFSYARARLYGLDLSATYAEGPVKAWANLGLGRATARGIASGRGVFAAGVLAFVDQHEVDIDQDQRVTASGGMSYRLGRLSLSGDMQFGSGTPYTAPGGDPNGARLPSYFVANLSAVYTVRLLPGRPLDLRVDVTNLFDARYRLADGTGLEAGMPRWGNRRGVFVGIEQAF